MLLVSRAFSRWPTGCPVALPLHCPRRRLTRACAAPPPQLARLLALSHGEGQLTRERWAAMRALEARRAERLAA